ncbi:MAG TPA: AsmA family protein [Roseiarcus sp.]|nr:AsmA family protein [Roseiarcus sp.]
MRTVLTLVAVALVAVMSIALVTPYLIDWSSQRGEIEARLSAITGANVSLAGPIELRLLPTPYLALGEGEVSAPGQDGARLSFASARLELELIKLASGQFRFSDIRLEKPVLTLTRAPTGALKLPPLRMAGLHATGFDRLSVRDGRVKIIGAAGSEISGVEIDAAAPWLGGPAHLNGQFSGPNNVPVVFQLASEKPGPEGTPLRLAVDAGARWPAAEFDGALQGDPAAGIGALRLVGATILTGTAPGGDGPTPWRIAGSTTVDLNQATLRQAEFRLGPEERAIRAEGEARLVFGSPVQISAALKSKQVNLDSLMRRKGEDAVAPARAAALIARFVVAALEGPGNEAAIDVRISAQPIILGAQTLPDASATVKAAPGAPLDLSVNVGLPGQGRLRVDGDLTTSPEAKFRGAVVATSADFTLLREWAAQGAPSAAARLAAFATALPYRSVSASGAVEASAVGFSGRNLKLTLDRSTLTGAVAFKGAQDGQPGRLDMDLASDSLDVDGLPDLTAANLIGDLDLSLSLRAGSLHIARVGEAQIDSGSLAVNVTKAGPEVTLKRLSVAGLDGASFDVEGAIGPDSTAATGHLRADRLHDFAALVSRVAPGDWSRMLVERAAELSPAALTFGAHGGAADANGIPAVDSLRANGSAGETRFKVTLDPRPNDSGRALTVSLDSPNSGALLRQLGVHTPTSGGGQGAISVNANGSWEKGYDVDAASELAGAKLTWRGRFAPAAESGGAKLFGSATAKSPNLAPLAIALGLAPANGGALGPADIGFDATLRGARWSLSRLQATIAGIKASGDLTLQPAKPPEIVTQASDEIARAEEAVGSAAAPRKPSTPTSAEIEGQLTVERMPLSGALALTLGPPQPGRGGARWSDVRFAAPPLRPPSAAVKLKVGTLDLVEGLTARDFMTTLRFDRGRLDLDDFAMKIAGGSASGRATLRRDGDTVTLTGALALDSVALDHPGFSGRIGAALDFASTGRSPAALISGLAGSGTATFAGAALARSDPAALDRVVAKSQTPDAPLDETNIAYGFGNELSRAPLAIPDGPTPLSLSAGVMKIGPIKIREGQEALGADLDLRTLTAQARFTLTSSASQLKFWSGPPPSAAVTVDNALEAPKRQVDVSALAAALAAQAIARESDRISTMEADIRERAYFNRRLKGERFMDRRQREIEDWEAEQARLKGQADRLRSLEEAERAAEADAAKRAADGTGAQKAKEERGSADRLDAAKEERGQATVAPFAPAPAAKSDEVGANAPASRTPPPRPKPRPTQVDPEPGRLY